MSAVTATKPGQVVKKKLTLTQAEEQWIKADDRIAREKALKDEAAAVLTEHLTKRGLVRYKRVELVCAKPSRVLDQQKVKEFLGRKLEQFMKLTDPQPRLARVSEAPKKADADTA